MEPGAARIPKSKKSPLDVLGPSGTLFHNFEMLKEKVLEKRPVLREVLKKRGRDTLIDYANGYVDVNLNPPIVKRQSEFFSVIKEVTEERFGKETAEGVVKQLEKYYFVSTADHVGPLTHPFFLNANLLTAIASHTHTDPDLKYILVLACANISLNNSSFPRGLLFNTYKNNELHQQRLSFLPSNSHSCSAYNFRPYTSDEVVKVQKRLKEIIRDESLNPKISNDLESIIQDIYAQPEILAAKSFREQSGKTNRHLWNRFFTKSNVKLPELLHIDQEDVVIRLLTKYHLTEDTLLNHMLFDPEYEPFLNEYFDGIFGSFSRKDATGTYLFWALPKGAKLNKQLFRKGNFLVTKDESFKVELKPEPLRAAMLSGELVPSLLVNFMTISFYYGLKCLGGFNQINYLTLMKNAYIKMNVELGNYRSIEVCARAQTKELCDGLTLAFLGYDKGRVALASGIDLILYGQEDSYQRLEDLCKTMTLEEGLNPLMPEIYRISYDEKEWQPELLAVTEKDVNELTGLDQKVKPCVFIQD